ncbi:PREDICTED: uncharacterized protein LOC109182338 [Ipomoea nil]|uniref:uncharacterized protein LOC109182338 n=1 Tax=Ipomoea nil TaxID=35883 RepID=UPI00090096C1|nr:PREDICTED: uncharacterized protein LOC109182338 [Ipomoea nil]
MNSSFNTTPNFDNLLLQSLMGRLQIRPSPPPNPALLSAKSLEDLLLNNLLSDQTDDPDDDDDDDVEPSYKSQLAKEESKLEKEIIRTIHSGNTDSLKPNSGQAVTIGEHHICVGFHEDEDSDYRVWEWHGHIILFDDENGYNPEYIYGNYFERLTAKPAMKKKQSEEKEVEKVGNMGLKELIESAESNSEARILRRNINAGSSNFKSGSS